MQHVTGLLRMIVEVEKIIGQKVKIIKDQYSEFRVHLYEAIVEHDNLKYMSQAQKKNYEATIEKLENELKNKPEVLNIPPLKTIVGQEA